MMKIVFILISIYGVNGQNWEFLENLDVSVGENQTNIEGWGFSREESSIVIIQWGEIGEVGSGVDQVTESIQLEEFGEVGSGEQGTTESFQLEENGGGVDQVTESIQLEEFVRVVSGVEGMIEGRGDKVPGGKFNTSDGNLSVKVQNLNSDSSFWGLTICASILILFNTVISTALYFKMRNLQIIFGHDNVEMWWDVEMFDKLSKISLE